MNNSGHNEEDSRRYWKAAISALPTAEQRNAAWEFYVEKFSGNPRAGDTLSGLILLLEANGAYLLTLPEKYQVELIQPVAEQLRVLRKELHDNSEREQASLRAAEAISNTLKKANLHLDFLIEELFDVRAAAIRHIDIVQLAKEVDDQLQASIVAPLKAALSDLPEQSKRIAAATKAAESGVETWRKVHLGGIILNTCLVTIVICLMLLAFASVWLQRR